MTLTPTRLTLLCACLALSHALRSTPLSFRFFHMSLASRARTNAVALTTDPFGNTFVVGNTDADVFGLPDTPHLASTSIFAAKFSKSGYLIWATRTGSSHPDSVYAVTYFVAALYITGTTRGNISLGADPHSKSAGIQDGFVLAYDSFTGRRRWSKQFGAPNALTEVNSVTVSESAAVVVAGHSNASIFDSTNTAASFASSRDHYFLATLNYAVGTVSRRVQQSTSSAATTLVPVQITTSQPRAHIYILLKAKAASSKASSILIALSEKTFKVEATLTLTDKNMNKLSRGMALDNSSGNLVVSYSVYKENQNTRDFGIQEVSSSLQGHLNKTETIDLEEDSDDICTGIVVNSVGYAFLLGSITHRSEKPATPGIWIYDLWNRTSVGTFVASRSSSTRLAQVTGLQLDYDGNVVFAGFQTSQDGIHSLSLGTFGIPKHLKARKVSEESGHHTASGISEPASAGNMLGQQNEPVLQNGDGNGNVIASEPSGTLSTKSILIICLCVLSVVCGIAVAGWCLFRFLRRKPST